MLPTEITDQVFDVLRRKHGDISVVHGLVNIGFVEPMSDAEMF
jgi:hypothetical protein